MQIPFDGFLIAKTAAVVLAVGLDVLAISVGVGVAQKARGSKLKIGLAFAAAEVLMQVLGYALGAGAGHLLGDVAVYGGFALLALVGAFMFHNSYRAGDEGGFDPSRGTGLLMTALSVSLDSLGVGIALPAMAIPLLPLLIVLAITTTLFTLLGLAFGARLGLRYERRAERVAGAILIVLAIIFSVERVAI